MNCCRNGLVNFQSILRSRGRLRSIKFSAPAKKSVPVPDCFKSGKTYNIEKAAHLGGLFALRCRLLRLLRVTHRSLAFRDCMERRCLALRLSVRALGLG